MQETIHGVVVECKAGNIADQPDMAAVVNAANAELRIGGGVAGAIHRAAGPGLEQETRALAPINPGDAVITSGHNLPNPYVIHCLGPVYGVDEPAEEYLAECYRNALQLAEENNIRSVAFPALSTGAFGYPMETAARVAFATLLFELPRQSTLEKVRFVLFSDADLEIHKQAFRAVLDR